MSVYLDGSTVDECRDLLQRGARLEVLASRLRISPDDLKRLLRLHQQPRSRAAADSGEVDLWADGAGVSALSAEAIENIRQLRGFAIPWEQVAAAVGASEADCRAALGLSMQKPPGERARLPWDRRNLFEQ